MKDVFFDPAGAALSINIKYLSKTAENLFATYTYTLWAANSNAIVDKRSGNNFNDEDDVYWLPTPASSNSGRIIDVFSTLKNVGAEKIEVKVRVEVCQGGATIGSDTDEETIEAKSTSFSELFIHLVPKES
jgi:hypothetical protein